MENEYKQLNRFTGHWKTKGLIQDSSGSPGVEVNGTDMYEWLAGGFFLKHTVDVMIGDERNQTLEIIGYDKAARHYTMHYFNNSGETGFMKAINTDEFWVFTGDQLRFNGGFSENDTVFSGTWEKCNEEGHWMPFMNIVLRREI